MIRTPLAESSGFDVEAYEEVQRLNASIYPARRIGTVQDTTNVILFLASSKADFLTGLRVPVDGGLTSTSAQTAAQIVKDAQEAQDG